MTNDGVNYPDELLPPKNRLAQNRAASPALLEAIPDLIFRLNRQGIHLEMIPGKDQIPAPSPEEIIGKSLFDIFPPNQARERLSYIEQALDTGQPQQHEFQFTVGDKLRFEEARVVPLNPDEVIVLVRDITGRKQAELERERLLAEEREQRLVAQILGDVFLTLSAQTSHTTVLDEILRQARRLVAYSAANIMLLDGYTLRLVRSQGYDKFGSAAWVAALEQTLTELPLDYQVVRYRRPIVVPDTHQNPGWVIVPESSWIRSFAAVPISRQDKVLGLLRLDSDTPNTFSNKDIRLLMPLANAAAIALENTRLFEQARHELEERKQVEQELRQIATRNQAIINAIPDAIFYLNHRGQLLDYKMVPGGNIWPRGAGEITIGAHLQDMLPPHLVELILNNIERTLQTHNIQVFEFQFTTPAGVQDFETRLVATGPQEVLAIVRDITGRKQAEQQAIRTERLAALGKLAATLAHEINNPMQAIQSHLDLLLKYHLEPEKTKQYLQIIHRHIERVNNLTEKILHLARPHPENSQPVHAAQVLQEVLMLAGKTLEQKNIGLTVDIHTAPPVFVDPDQLAQVFLNLIINAIEAITETGQLEIKVYPAGDYTTISFTNSGPAIPQNVLQHIFDPFFTTKPDGSGMGLWICHNFVEQHGGILAVKNLPHGQGVTFTLKLPCLEQ